MLPPPEPQVHVAALNAKRRRPVARWGAALAAVRVALSVGQQAGAAGSAAAGGALAALKSAVGWD